MTILTHGERKFLMKTKYNFNNTKKIYIFEVGSKLHYKFVLVFTLESILIELKSHSNKVEKQPFLVLLTSEFHELAYEYPHYYLISWIGSHNTSRVLVFSPLHFFTGLHSWYLILVNKLTFPMQRFFFPATRGRIREANSAGYNLYWFHKLISKCQVLDLEILKWDISWLL